MEKEKKNWKTSTHIHTQTHTHTDTHTHTHYFFLLCSSLTSQPPSLPPSLSPSSLLPLLSLLSPSSFLDWRWFWILGSRGEVSSIFYFLLPDILIHFSGAHWPFFFSFPLLLPSSLFFQPLILFFLSFPHHPIIDSIPLFSITSFQPLSKASSSLLVFSLLPPSIPLFFYPSFETDFTGWCLLPSPPWVFFYTSVFPHLFPL